jgi:hypothetical protein
MSLTGKQSPLGVNLQGAILNNQGMGINSVVTNVAGISKTNNDYVFGNLVQDTVLRLHTWGINDAYVRNLVSRTSSTDTYDNLINVGANSIPSLANTKPPTYAVEDPSGIWTTVAENYGAQKGVAPSLAGPANSGYALTGNTDQGQQASWLPYTGVAAINPNTSITQWGHVRLYTLQAWNEFNWNGGVVNQTTPEYKEFLTSFLSAQAFMESTNKSIYAMHNSKTFLEGVYSNMNDLITAEIAGVSLATKDFGADLVNLGKAIDLNTIDAFGLPSNLLQVLCNNSALNEELVYALLSVGLSSTEINNIAFGEVDTTSLRTQQLIYGSFLLITDEPLRDVLALLQCVTPGIQTLADLLSVKKLFPNSYETLTVPVYNISPGPTNSKTYYLLYANQGLNAQLTSPAIIEQIGTQLPLSISIINETLVEGTNYTAPSVGFGSYLYNIIPQADAVAAGAFAYSMQQIRNIRFCNFQTFAQAVRSLEIDTGLQQVNGTNKPTDETLADAGLLRTALGSGVHGTYTMSDFFGCMTGLPYPGSLVRDRIDQLQTTKLQNIYRENFLAITWEGAQVTVQYSTSVVEDPPGIFTTYYTVTGVTLTGDGGGYGRGSAPAPTITISGGSGATAICTIGTNDSDAGSNGTGTFGRVTSITLTSAGSSSITIPTITIQYPPTDPLAVQANGSVATGGTNTASGTTGWPSPMNAVVQAYIDQANTEIEAIQTSNPIESRILNTYWNICGDQLAREQRARYIAIPPVEVIEPDSSSVVRKDYFANPYPGTQSAFTDSVPEFAQDTRPHMTAQSLEAIANLCTTGGQSLIALMRESRNNVRLQEAGITLDNTIPDTMSDEQLKQLTTNGVLPNPGMGPVSTTIPAWANTIDCQTGELLYPIPNGVFANGQFNQTNEVAFGDIIPIIEGQENPVVSTLVPVGPQIQPFVSGTSISGEGVPISEPYIIAVPIQVNPAIPPQLDTQYTSSTLLPASPTIQEAIDKVIECNCDCWVN